MTEAIPEIKQSGLSLLAGKYLTFILSQEEYGVDILRVKEIIGLIQITPLPRTPPEVRGVVRTCAARSFR